MSAANLLERCTPGPWRVFDDDGIRGADDEVVVYSTDIDTSGVRNNPDAELIALAPDHALLLAAVTAGRAKWKPQREDVVLLASHEKERVFPTWLDAFGCPALPPELRAALREALGLSNG